MADKIERKDDVKAEAPRELVFEAPHNPPLPPPDGSPEATAAAGESPPATSRRRCPLCNGEMIDHGDENPHKRGAHHCTNPACGACWAPGMREMRAGHPLPKDPKRVEAP